MSGVAAHRKRRLPLMVSCDIVVEILPDPFDTIVIRAIRGRKVQLHLIVPSDLSRDDGLAAMNLEVVQDDVETLI